MFPRANIDSRSPVRLRREPAVAISRSQFLKCPAVAPTNLWMWARLKLIPPRRFGPASPHHCLKPALPMEMGASRSRHPKSRSADSHRSGATRLGVDSSQKAIEVLVVDSGKLNEK